MKIYIRLVVVLFPAFVSCNLKNRDTDDSKGQKEYSFQITDSNYTRLTDDNIDEIVNGYLNGNIKSVIAYSKIKKKGEAPYLILIFSKNNSYHFHSVKKINNAWSVLWADSINEDLGYYFNISDGKFTTKNFYVNINGKYEESLGLLYQGCYPHMCNSRNGLFYYDCENEKGYVALFSDEENFKPFYPLGTPKNYVSLEAFEELIYDKHREDNVSTLDVPSIENNVLALPTSRRLPQIYSVDDKSLSNIIRGMGAYQKSEKENIRHFHLFDYNSDNYLDFLFSSGIEFGYESVYLFSGKSNKVLRFNTEGIDLQMHKGFDALSYKEGGELYLVIISISGGASFDTFEPYLFKWDYSTFRIIKDQEKLKKILAKMQYDIKP